jgi:DNA-3-methyladenine glycosylase II
MDNSIYSVSALTDEMVLLGIGELVKVDADLSRLYDQLGAPPLWGREPGFPTLIHIILEQQVSLASAQAAFNRLLFAAAPLTPPRFLEFDDAELKQFGFSRQKTNYSRGLARDILEGRLDLDQLMNWDDDVVRRELLRIKGIGHWSADIYLLMALRRPDVWPTGDLALATAVQSVKKLESVPTQEQLEKMSLPWRPWRAVAARMFWHYYLSSPKQVRRQTTRLKSQIVEESK